MCNVQCAVFSMQRAMCNPKGEVSLGAARSDPSNRSEGFLSLTSVLTLFQEFGEGRDLQHKQMEDQKAHPRYKEVWKVN